MLKQTRRLATGELTAPVLLIQSAERSRCVVVLAAPPSAQHNGAVSVDTLDDFADGQSRTAALEPNIIAITSDGIVLTTFNRLVPEDPKDDRYVSIDGELCVF